MFERKPKYEEVAKTLEADVSDIKGLRNGAVPIFAVSLDDPQGTEGIFKTAEEADMNLFQTYITDIRETTDKERANFALGQYGDVLTRRMMLAFIEALNSRVSRQRELMLRLINAVVQRNEEEIIALRDELKEEMKDKGITNETKEKVDIFIKHFDFQSEEAKKQAELAQAKDEKEEKKDESE